MTKFAVAQQGSPCCDQHLSASDVQDGQSAADVAHEQGHAAVVALLLARTDRHLPGRTPMSPMASVAPSAPPLPSHTSLHNPAVGHMSPLQHHSENRLAQAAVDGAGGTVTRPDAVSYPSIFGSSSSHGSSRPQPRAESAPAPALPSQSCSVRAGPQQEEGGQYGSDSQQAEAVQADMSVLGYVPFALTSMFKRLQVRCL